MKISPEAKQFLFAGLQLQENFARLFTINDILNEAKIDITQLEKRIVRYDSLFENMLETSPIWQDWNFIVSELKDNLKEINEYCTWVTDVEKYDIQITEQEVEKLIQYREKIQIQIERLSVYVTF